MTKRFAVVVFFYLTCLFSCAKHGINPPSHTVSDLPPPTQTGANVIAWRTDSIPYIANGTSNIAATVYVDTNKTDTYYGTGNFMLSSTFVQKTGSRQAIRLVSTVEPIKFPIIPGTTFAIEDHTASVLFEDIDQNGSVGGSSLVYTAETGEITITRYDPVKKILSGTFSFTTESAAPKIRKVRDGWFDVNYTLIN
jgi:hypothetical protein